MKKLISIAACTLLLACQQPTPNYQPQKSTLINLDEADRTIAAETVPLQLIYDNQQYYKDGKRKMPHVGFIYMLTLGADSTLLLWDDVSKRVVQLCGHGRFVKQYQGVEEGPGKFENLHRILMRVGDEIFIPDFTNHIQVFDLEMKYLRTIKNTILERPYFAVGRHGEVLYAPSRTGQVCGPEVRQKKPGDLPPRLHPDLLHMITVHDGKSREVRHLGPVSAEDTLVFSFSRRLPYHILAGENSEYIWCVFDYYPAIRKYDYNGQFLEEIRFVSAEIDKSLREIGYLPKPHESMGGLLVLQNAHLTTDGELLVNIVHHGMVRLSGEDGVTRISRRYQFQPDPPQDEKEGPWLIGQLIGDTMYAYSQWGMIFKEPR